MTTVKTRKLGTTGLDIGELALGTWGLCSESYGKVYPEQRERTIQRALDQGIRVFDMAPSWGENGQSEKDVARVVGTRRHEVQYITRAGQRPHEASLEPAFTKAELEAECEASLARLATDRVDVWLLHEPRESDLRGEDARAAAEALKQTGKIRAWGASVSQLDTARAALEAGVEVLCLPFNLLRQELFRDLAPDLAARGVGVLAHSTLLYGALAGRWSAKKRFLPDDHRTQRWSSDALAERVQQVNDLRYLVQGNVLSMASAALRFVLAHDVVSSALLGARTPGQVEASVQSLVGEPYLSEEHLGILQKRA